ncbi:putative NADH2 dehydrogenase 40K chain [Gigaspora margarita]|uniref:Putative NADH2 dehydrogenase 40K chain n=1 Tax=Gigaspora margarita TaxID=4874 RepID=A0A8H4ETH4_GIGMA|nr:putative NADH2 dehydrogenase 40K chain [Gigaspora margarita]
MFSVGVISSRNLCIPKLSQKRFAHDLLIRQRTGKPIVKYGAGGRSSVSGHIATVFGCTGFLGRYIVSKLARQGTQVIVPYRDEDSKRHLKVCGDLGQVIPLEFDLRNEKNIEEAVKHSDIVYNLIGRDYDTRNFSLEKVHVEGAARIAKISRELGVDRFVHVSALNADKNSSSKFYRSKALGEEAVKKEFPDATIVRPSTIFGQEDRFLTRYASTKYGYIVNGGRTKVRPVHVFDVALALERMQKDESAIGETYELYGPREYHFEQVLDLIDELIDRRRLRFNIPKPIALAFTKAFNLPFLLTISPEEIEKLYVDDKITPEAKTFENLGIRPLSLEMNSLGIVRRFRNARSYDQPLGYGRPIEKSKAEKKREIHVEY